MNNVINNQKAELSRMEKMILELKEAEASKLAFQKIQEVILPQTILYFVIYVKLLPNNTANQTRYLFSS